MRTFRALAVIPAALLLLAACSDDKKADTTTSGDAVTTTVTGDTTVDTSGGTDAGGTMVAGPVQIDVRVGIDSGEDRIEHVAIGSEITLNITNSNAADSYHVHGVDLEQDVAVGVMATFNFTADTAGTYEVESHNTEDVLVVIDVS